jgi:hypothetical protein
VAIRWSLDHGEVEEIARTARASRQFWRLQGLAGEGRRWMEEALAKGANLPDFTRATLLFIASTLAQDWFAWEAAAAMAEESLTLFRRIGDEQGVGLAVGSAGVTALGQGRYREGITPLEESIELGLRLGQSEGPGILSSYATSVRLVQGDTARARELAEQGLALAKRERGGRFNGAAHPHAGRPRRARPRGRNADVQ